MREMVDPIVERYHSLAVSGECSAGKSTLCEILSRRFSWIHIDVGSEFRKIAKLEGLRIEEFGSIPDPLLRQIDNQVKQRVETEENRIWDGRLVCFLAHNCSNIFKVYCVANLDVRAQRSANRNRLSFQEAKSRVLARDNEEAKVFRRLYCLPHPCSREWVNLRLDTSTDSPRELADEVVRALTRD